MLTDEQAELKMNTLFDGTIKTALPPAMKDFIAKKKDGFPAYQLASVIDDMHFGVDLVIRGQDLWDSTLAQLYLAEQIDASAFKQCTFHHHALLNAPSGMKLSKSAGDTSIHYLRSNGAKSSDIYGQIGRMLGLLDPISSWQQLVG